MGAFASTPGLSAAADRPSDRAAALAHQMTLDEKIGLTEGGVDSAYLGQAGYAPGVPRLGIPDLRLADGPVGILNRYDTTALPQTIALASAFDPALAADYGTVLGREARATGMDVAMGPMVNIARLPNWGRNITSFGEDPLLAGTLAAPEVRAIQAQGVMATVKHFVANNQSDNVGGGLNGAPGYDFVVDDRTLHEIYLPAFEEALHAGAASAMAAYNRLNGPWNAESAPTLTGILRDELGWDGFVISDWHANHATTSIAAGLDMEMPGSGPLRPVGREPPFWGERLKVAIQSGQVPQAALDRAVERILTQMDRLGMLDGRRVPAPAAIDVEADATVARKVALQGAVLLKNAGGLPLAAGDGPVVLIGPTAGQVAVGPGAGRSEGIASRLVSPLKALRAALGDAAVAYAPGEDLTGVAIPASALSSASAVGLERVPADGSPITRDSGVDFTGTAALSAGRGVTWRGALTVPKTGEYTLSSQSWGGSTNLYLDGKLIAGSARLSFGNGVPHRLSGLLPTTDDLDNGQATMRLEAGRAYAIELRAQPEPDRTMQVRLAWITPEMRHAEREAAVEAARRAKTAVVFAWSRGGEGFDNAATLALPDEQDTLISAVAAVNPRTIVVLNTGGPVGMPWLDKVSAVLEMWFPGQEGGWATADLLTGRASPGGRLPITFPKRATDTPALAPGHPERGPGVDGKVTYSEGIFVGYRHYDKEAIAPLFPFGYGLTYTRFDYSDLKAAPGGDGLDVSFTVRNVGAQAGVDTPQVYVAPPAGAPVPMAVKTLGAFARVELAPGASRIVRLHVAGRQLGYWSGERCGWLRPGGARQVILAADAATPRLTTTVDLPARVVALYGRPQ